MGCVVTGCTEKSNWIFGAACFRACFDFDDLPCSDEATDPAVAVAGQEVDDRNLNHSVAARTLAHSCTSYTDKNLTRECRIVYLHVSNSKSWFGSFRSRLCAQGSPPWPDAFTSSTLSTSKT